MQELYDLIKMLPEEENDEVLRSSPEEVNDEYLRSAESSPKIQNDGTDIDGLVVT